MLITAQLAILIKYQWDFRLFKKRASADEQALLQHLNWHDLAELLADLKRYHQNLVSAEYAKKIHADLLAVCADEQTAQTLLGYASTL